MADRNGIIPPGKAAGLLKAIKTAGYTNARIIHHPDGRIELVGEDQPSLPSQETRSPFEAWEAENADKT
ncbi:MAG: transcription factor iiib subunit [Roseibium sp.]